MALVSLLPPTVEEIPHEPGNYLQFRKPASPAVKEARRIVDSEGRKGVADFGPEIVKAMQSGSKADEERLVQRAKQLEAEQLYEPSKFDRATLLKASIVGWGGPNYEDENHKPRPVTSDRIADLDEETAEWAHRYIVSDLVKPKSKEADKSPIEAVAPSA
jgi:hypothetical protein